MSKRKLCVRKKVSKVMGEWKSGKLKLQSGQKVKAQRQAIAIALNMARKSCGKNSVPYYRKKKSTRKSSRKSKSFRKSRSKRRRR